MLPTNKISSKASTLNTPLTKHVSGSPSLYLIDGLKTSTVRSRKWLIKWQVYCATKRKQTTSLLVPYLLPSDATSTYSYSMWTKNRCIRLINVQIKLKKVRCRLIYYSFTKTKHYLNK